MSDRPSREEWIAIVRAEIERDGIHVAISDDELWEALISPLRDRWRRYLKAETSMEIALKRAGKALADFAIALEAGDAIDRTRADIEGLPSTDEERS